MRVAVTIRSDGRPAVFYAKGCDLSGPPAYVARSTPMGWDRVGVDFPLGESPAFEIDPSADQLAILAVLLLRGPQTPGELRSRTARYFVAEQPLDAIESLLEDLMTRSIPLVERLPREPGQKENRFRDLLTDPATVVPEAAGAPAPVADPLTDRVAVLERRVAALARSLGVEFNDLDQSFE